MRLTIVPKSTMTKTIASVRCEKPLGTAGAPLGPPGDQTDGLNDQAIIWNAGSLGSISSDPTYSALEGDLWSSDGFQLYETDIDNDGTNDQWGA